MNQSYAARMERAFTGLTEQPDIDAITSFVRECAKADGGMVSGNRLALKANKLLGHGDVVQFVPSDDSEGGAL